MYRQENSLKTILRYIFASSIIIISFIYLYILVRENPDALRHLIFQIPASVLLVTIILSACGGLNNAYVWHHINQKVCPDTRFYTSFYAWSVSRIFRYIPGKAFGYLVRQKLQQSNLKHGIKSSINEALVTILSISILSAIYFSTHLDANNAKLFLIISFLLAVFITFSYEFSRKLDSVIKNLKFKSNLQTLFIPSKNIFISAVYGLPPLLMHGGAFYLLLRYGFDLNTLDFLYLTITLYFSGLIGQLALIAPAGIGVREASLTFLLVNQGISADIALSSAIASRVILIISEVFNISIAYVLKKINEHD